MVGNPLPTSLLAGVPVHVVAARLGHADPAVTLRVYARPHLLTGTDNGCRLARGAAPQPAQQDPHRGW